MYASAAAITAPPAMNFPFIVAGSARPPHSVGGPSRGAVRLRSAWRCSFQGGRARPPHSVGGPSRGAVWLRSAWRYSFQGGSARPPHSVGGPSRGAVWLRSAWRYSFQGGSARPPHSVGGPSRGAVRRRSAWRCSFQGGPRGRRTHWVARHRCAELLLAPDQTPPVGEQDQRGEPVGGEDEAPVVRHQAAASASSRSRRTRLARK